MKNVQKRMRSPSRERLVHRKEEGRVILQRHLQEAPPGFSIYFRGEGIASEVWAQMRAGLGVPTDLSTGQSGGGIFSDEVPLPNN